MIADSNQKLRDALSTIFANNETIIPIVGFADDCKKAKFNDVPNFVLVWFKPKEQSEQTTKKLDCFYDLYIVSSVKNAQNATVQDKQNAMFICDNVEKQLYNGLFETQFRNTFVFTCAERNGLKMPIAASVLNNYSLTFFREIFTTYTVQKIVKNIKISVKP